jgi:hypothetical protein
LSLSLHDDIEGKEGGKEERRERGGERRVRRG